MKRIAPLLLTVVTAACSPQPEMFAFRGANVKLVEGPPISDVQTGFDEALGCLRGKIPTGVVFAVGQVTDATGKENYSEGGAGKYVTQGAGEVVQSALFRAGVSVVNRRDSSVTINEANWGIRDIKRQVPVNFYISGSINSLDFIPGGGGIASVGGIGPRYRQSRILIALDLSLTDAFTGRVVASVPLQKQIFTSEIGAGINNFFGTTLVQLDAGGMHREAMHFALRQMLHLATFELLGQIMDQEIYATCRAQISEGIGAVSHTGTADPGALVKAIQDTNDAPGLAIPVSKPDEPAPPPEAGSTAGVPVPAAAGPTEAPLTLAEQLGQKATEAATMAIKAARDSEAAPDRKIAVQRAAESLQLANLSLIALKKAAEAGFSGDDGEVAAVVVQQALKAAQMAGSAAAARPADPIPGPVGIPEPSTGSAANNADPARDGQVTAQPEGAEP